MLRIWIKDRYSLLFSWTSLPSLNTAVCKINSPRAVAESCVSIAKWFKIALQPLGTSFVESHRNKSWCWSPSAVGLRDGWPVGTDPGDFLVEVRCDVAPSLERGQGWAAGTQEIRDHRRFRDATVPNAGLGLRLFSLTWLSANGAIYVLRRKKLFRDSKHIKT